jgi:hypothetical protein
MLCTADHNVAAWALHPQQIENATTLAIQRITPAKKRKRKEEKA